MKNELGHKHDDIWANYDPQRVKQAIRESAGILAGVDHNTLLRDIKEQRRQDNQGRPA